MAALETSIARREAAVAFLKRISGVSHVEFGVWPGYNAICHKFDGTQIKVQVCNEMSNERGNIFLEVWAHDSEIDEDTPESDWIKGWGHDPQADYLLVIYGREPVFNREHGTIYFAPMKRKEGDHRECVHRYLSQRIKYDGDRYLTQNWSDRQSNATGFQVSIFELQFALGMLRYDATGAQIPFPPRSHPGQFRHKKSFHNERLGRRLLMDFETRSMIDLKEYGASAYAEHPSTEILCLYWRIGTDGARGLWIPGMPLPEALVAHILAGGVIEAHNARFEKAIWKYIMVAKFGAPVPDPDRWVDTMATCAYRALPQSLDEVGNVLDLEIKKDKRGKQLITLLSKPVKAKAATKNKPAKEAHFREDFGLLEEMYAYCEQDADTEYDLSQRVGDLPPSEYSVWQLDQRINERGVFIDVEAVLAAKRIAESVEMRLTDELRLVTNGAVKKHTELAKMKDWLSVCFGIEPETMDANALEYWVKTLTEKVKEDESFKPALRVFIIRQLLAKASTKKLDKFITTLNRDGRVRGLLQYHGAGTGRWAGRLIQPQNFPRGTIKDIETLIKFIKLCGEMGAVDTDLFGMVYGDHLAAIASALRGMIIAGPGKRFYFSDFSAIEARVTMWLAGQLDALEVFHKADRKEGPDIYCYQAEKIYGYPIDKAKHPDERQLGKVTILGCGYQMSGPRLREQAEDDYGIILTEARAAELVKIYRESNPEVPKLWRGLEQAAIDAVKTGKPHSYRSITYETVEDEAGKWLTCRLPSGRRLWYFNPEMRWNDTKWGAKLSLSYESRDNKHGGVWNRVYTYGGMLTENVVQAISRDIMVEAMFRVEDAGYPIVLSVHDEIGSETDDDFGSLKEFERLMSLPPTWAADCPIAVEGWTGYRYRK